MTFAELDIWRAAQLMQKRYGEGAVIQAGMRADELLAEGDVADRQQSPGARWSVRSGRFSRNRRWASSPISSARAPKAWRRYP